MEPGAEATYEEVVLRDPDRPSLGRYIDVGTLSGKMTFEEYVDDASQIARDVDEALHFVSFHHCRSFDLYRLKHQGSEVGPETRINWRGQNLWSVLRNLHDRRSRDTRYDSIIEFMRRAFPGSFQDIVFEQTGPTSLYASLVEYNRREPIYVSGASDGTLQMLLLLSILFGQSPKQNAMIILDEPEISLHPWALAVLGEAVHRAAQEWNKQILIATHSPVLISQFDPDELVAAEMLGDRTRLRRLSTITEVQDLLAEYAPGSLYMAGEVAAQQLVDVGHDSAKEP